MSDQNSDERQAVLFFHLRLTVTRRIHGDEWLLSFHRRFTTHAPMKGRQAVWFVCSTLHYDSQMSSCPSYAPPLKWQMQIHEKDLSLAVLDSTMGQLETYGTAFVPLQSAISTQSCVFTLRRLNMSRYEERIYALKITLKLYQDSSTPVGAAAPASAMVNSLPGFTGNFPSKQYSGYIAVDKARGRNLFYYFVTSQGNPVTDPLVLWLNGGPGCSSMDAFIYEHGPFNFKGADKPGSQPILELNPFSWTKISNIIYLESPAGVGYSYSDTVDDYITGDLKTASDTYKFLLKWFEEYQEFASNDFFIAGESYAGVYVPTLAREVTNGIEAGLQPAINFKGYLIGNGVTDQVYDGNALVPFVHGMGLIPDDLYQEVKEACNESYWNPANSNCQSKLGTIKQAVSKLNRYDILEPCYHSTEIQEVISIQENLPESFKTLGDTDRPLPVRRRMFGRAWPMWSPVRDGKIPTWPQLGRQHLYCMDTEVAHIWSNNPLVRKAIHAQSLNCLPPTIVASLPLNIQCNENVSGKWQICADRIHYNHDGGSMIEYHRNLTSKGYRVLIFSGDHDMCVPYTGSEAWTRSLGYKIIDQWRPWFVDDQVAGYTRGYDHNLTFATIKGSGHTVPEYKPRQAFAFYKRWLGGQPL
eukprot:Gb_23232 [translate_table: standard]